MQNEIMGEAPQRIERRLILPNLEGMSYGDLRYIATAISEYAQEVSTMVDQKQQARIEELKAQMQAAQAELAALEPPRVKMVTPSKPKYRDPDKPENTWGGRGKQPTWLKEKIEAGASLDDFLIDKPEPTSPDDPGF